MKVLNRKNVWLVATCVVVSVIVLSWILYALAGHPLIRAVYTSENYVIQNHFMAGRHETRLEDYYYSADTALLRITLYILIGWFLVLGLVKEPLGLLLSGISFVLCSFILFAALEIAPGLIQPLHLNFVPYYAFKSVYVQDASLAYQEKPFRKETIQNYRIGEPQAALNGVQAKYRTMEWITDENGFRNDPPLRSADVVLIGDSFLEYGDNSADTFAKQLEMHLGGLKVLNLGKSGYGPFQYIEVFKRYGLDKNARYAVFAFYAGNDISDIRKYVQWKERRANYDTYTIASQSFLDRYIFAMQSTLRSIQDVAGLNIHVAAKKLLRTEYIYPNLTVIQLQSGQTYKTDLGDTLATASPDALLQSDEWIQLKKILESFKEESSVRRITPVVLYLPPMVEIYAEYTTKDSGKNWLAIRDEQIRGKNNQLTAMLELCHEFNIPVVNLVPRYEEAARDGQMLYEPFNTHWNTEGREVAAEYLARELRALDQKN